MATAGASIASAFGRSTSPTSRDNSSARRPPGSSRDNSPDPRPSGSSRDSAALSSDSSLSVLPSGSSLSALPGNFYLPLLSNPYSSAARIARSLARQDHVWTPPLIPLIAMLPDAVMPASVVARLRAARFSSPYPGAS